MKNRRVTLLQLVAATFFIVSGGPYGIEDLVRDSGYLNAMIILLLVPIIWSVPTALMVGELASAIPVEGGYYVWVRRALGPFWGFQEAWLSLVASIFDMALYPTLFVAYLSQLVPGLQAGNYGFALGLSVIVICALWNLRGASDVSRSTLLSSFLVLLPFAIIVFTAFFQPPITTPMVNRVDGSVSTLLMGVLVAMWNYMGWDNAATIASEVENPQRTYPRAIALSVLLVMVVYMATVGAAWYAHIDPGVFQTGGWATVGNLLGGKWLATAIVIGGSIAAFTTFNSLVMSYSRIPYAMAQDKLLPSIFLKKLKNRDAPWFSILCCSLAWAVSLTIGFQHLIQLDILLYGLSLILEFIALVALRIKEPNLDRPFKISGGLIGTILLSILPAVLVAMSIYQGHNEQFLGINISLFASVLIAAGIIVYYLMRLFKSTQTTVAK